MNEQIKLVLHYTRLERLVGGTHDNFIGPFIMYGENGVLRMREATLRKMLHLVVLADPLSPLGDFKNGL
jgi:hypothetical protein